MHHVLYGHSVRHTYAQCIDYIGMLLGAVILPTFVPTIHAPALRQTWDATGVLMAVVPDVLTLRPWTVRARQAGQ